MAFSDIAFAQDCKVLLKTINTEYTGDCKRGKADGYGTAKGIDTYEGQFKKGLPHGEGTYTWQNGNVYKGTFKKGVKEGKGELAIRTENVKDSIIIGFWKKDTYAGIYEKPFRKIEKSQNVSSIGFRKIENDINALRFYVRTDQKYVRSPEISVVVHSGRFQTQINNRDFVELTEVTYPIKLRVYYRRDFFEAEIYESGLWNVKLDITYMKGLNTQN